MDTEQSHILRNTDWIIFFHGYKTVMKAVFVSL